jgi:DNA-binding LytR/AlgR family response regulator
MIRKPSILILGPDATTRRPFAQLEELGCDVHSASKAAEAAGLCLFTPPDLIVVTGRNNGIDEFIGQLKEQNKLKVLDMAMVSANGEEAVDEAIHFEERVTAALEELDTSKMRAKHFFTKVGNKLRRIHLNDVRFIEVEGKYSAIHVGEKKYNVKASLKDLLLKLPNEDFVRVSRNFVINIDRVTHIDTFQFIIKIDQDEIPISRTYKDELMKRIQLL